MSDTTKVPESEVSFVVVERPLRGVHKGRVLLKTDDWVAAETAALTPWPNGVLRSVKGTHPSHAWDESRPRRCKGCGAWDNGSYGSHAPCGYDWSHDSLFSALQRERDQRALSPEGEAT